jgi:hypothetical protein
MRRLRRGSPAPAERGRRAAVLLPALLLVVGLGLGGAAGWRSVTHRPPPSPTASAPLLVKGVEGPIAELRGLGEIAYTDQGGVVGALAPDGATRRVLGHAGSLRGAPAGGEPGDRTTVSADGTLADGYLDDGGPVAVRLADAQVRRLSPPATVAAAATRRSADGTVVAACAGRRTDGNAPGVDHPATSILDRDGQQLASFPGCLLDLARDGRAALLPDPLGDGPVRGVQLWQRSGGRRPVLAHAAAVAAARLVDPAAGPARVVVDGAWLAPDARRALVRVGRPRGRSILNGQPLTGDWRPGSALVLVDTSTGRWRLVPSETSGGGSVAWAPTGGFAYALPPDSWDPSGGGLLVTYVPPAGEPTLVQVSGRSDSRLAFSPDGDWLLLPGGGRWVFIRVDDPSVRVSYDAPGELAGWLPGRGVR